MSSSHKIIQTLTREVHLRREVGRRVGRARREPVDEERGALRHSVPAEMDVRVRDVVVAVARLDPHRQEGAREVERDGVPSPGHRLARRRDAVREGEPLRALDRKRLSLAVASETDHGARRSEQRSADGEEPRSTHASCGRCAVVRPQGIIQLGQTKNRVFVGQQYTS